MKYVGAGFIILSSDLTHILLVCEEKTKKWGFPKGHAEPIDENNSLRTAIRELKEETRITESHYTVCDQPFKIPNTSHTYIFRYAVMNHKWFNPGKYSRYLEIADIKWVSINKLMTDEYTIHKHVTNGNKYLRSWVAMITKNTSARAMYLFNELRGIKEIDELTEELRTLPLSEPMCSTGIVTCT